MGADEGQRQPCPSREPPLRGDADSAPSPERAAQSRVATTDTSNSSSVALARVQARSSRLTPVVSDAKGRSCVTVYLSRPVCRHRAHFAACVPSERSALMRVGISIGTVFQFDNQRETPRSVLEQTRAAARAGLDTISFGDGHSTGPLCYIQNVPMLGRILAEWDSRPAGCLFLMPLWHPVLMAEQIGTLAALASGPFIIQTGVGAWRASFAAMGARLADRGRPLEEGIVVVRALLNGESVSSTTWGIADARIAPLPPAGTEWWIGATAPVGIDRAARLGDCWYGNANLQRPLRRRPSPSITRPVRATGDHRCASRSGRTCSSQRARQTQRRWGMP